MSNKNRNLKNIIWILCEAFAFISIIRFAVMGDWSRISLAASTMVFIWFPRLAELLFKKKMSLWAYILCTVYSLGPMLGHAYYLYYLLPWWDDILHLTGGVVFCLLGLEFSRAMCLGKDSEVSFWLLAIFGFCFSVTLSVFWEFAEYFADMLFQVDMQSDTVVHSISSFNLAPEPGIRNEINNIEEVIINGRPMGVGGYLDIGLIDTMEDLLRETLASAVTTVIFAVRKGRFRVFYGNEPVTSDNRK